MTNQLYPTFDAPQFVMADEEQVMEDVFAHRFDFEDGHVVINGTGWAVEGTAIDAYQFWAVNCVLTERYQYPVYSDDFGTEFLPIIRAGYPRAITESEVKRTITEALMVDQRTVSVRDFEFKWEGDSCWIDFRIDSVYAIHHVSVQRGGEMIGRVRTA